MRTYLCLIFLCCYTTLVVGQTTTIYYVNANDGNDTNTGDSWNAPFATLQKALTAVGTPDAMNPAEIWVAKGTYYPDEVDGMDSNSRTASFTMKNHLSIYGGFPDTGNPNLTNRDFMANETILSGDLMKNDDPNADLTDLANRMINDNSYHVIHNDNNNLDDTAILDGFTISGGHADDGGNRRGGGVYNTGGSPMFSNCQISGNVASSSTYAYGGGISNNNSSPTFSNCQISGNVVSASSFSAFGGGVYNDEGSSPTFSNCQISGNVAAASSAEGGGVFNNVSSPTFSNCQISGNVASSSTNAYGGGISNNNSSPTFSNCQISGNVASASSFFSFGGGVSNTGGSSPTFSNCQISGNVAFAAASVFGISQARGGGVYSENGNITFINCTFSGNTANGAQTSSGGALHNHFGTVILTNCIVWNNQAVGATTNARASIAGNATPTYSNSLIQHITMDDMNGNKAGDPTDPNYPQFISPINPPTDATGATAAGDYRLKTTSPVLDLGTNTPFEASGSAEGIETDLAGNIRIWPTTVDMGAYETGAPACQTILYVNDDVVAGGDSTGTSWQNALPHLQDALAAARKCSTIKEIWVAKGTYFPDEGTGLTDNNREHSFSMINGVKIYGGLAGDEPDDYDLTQRDFTTNETILSGDLMKNDNPNADLTDLANRMINDNSHHVLNNNNLDNTAILDGFTISGGHADDGGGSQGGGILNNSSSPIFSNCQISGNVASATSVAHGGGVFNSGGSPTFSNCQISGNVASASHVFGGGVYNNGGSPKFSNCQISGNVASATSVAQGGGVYNSGNNTFTFTFINCQISGNVASAFAGSISSLAHGGGVFNNGNNTTFINCQISGNVAFASAASTVNEAHGGGVFNNGNKIFTFINCTFSGNTANGSQQSIGGALYNNNVTVILTNCIVWNNQAGGVTTNANASIAGNVTPTHSLIQHITMDDMNDNKAGDPTDPNYPQFISPIDPPTDATGATSAGDYRLQPCSPVINIGTNTPFEAGGAADEVTTDLAGNPRIFDQATGGTVDMGAYEYQGNPFAEMDTIIYVDSSKVMNMVQDGTGWVTAYASLQDALSTARACNTIKEIWVAKGTYFPDEGTGLTDNNREHSFSMINGVKIYGGLAGNEPDTYDLTQRDFTTNETILSGDLMKNDDPNADLTDLANRMINDNSHHVIHNDNNNLDDTAILDGFTISGGHADGGRQGGGILNNSSSPIFSNCQISGNVASSTSYAYGGGVYNTGGSPTFSNCQISGNLASSSSSSSSRTYGGGVYNFESSPTFSNCQISGNVASSSSFIAYGGGVSNNGGSPAFSNCQISGNVASASSFEAYGGGVFNNGGSPNFSNCTFSGNTVEAGFEARGGALYNNGTVILTNCIVWNNQAGSVTTNADASVFNDGATTTYSHSLIQHITMDDMNDNKAGDPTDPNYPQFISPIDPPTDATGATSAGDYRLQPCSPVINMGTNTPFEAGGAADEVTTDLAGNPRIFDQANGGMVDMGAYEYQGNPINVDITGTTELTCPGEVNLADKLTGNLVGAVRYGPVFGEYPDTITTLVNILSDTTFYIRDSLSMGCVDTAEIKFTLIDPVVITTQPTSASKCPSEEVTFSVVATGSNLTYQWKKGTENLDGKTNASLTLSNVQASDAAMYSVVVSNTCSSVMSSAATLTVLQPVQITTQPTNASKCVGENVTFMVTATGSPTLSYQWKKGGTAIMGATANIFQLTDVQASDAGDYTVEVSNTCGSVMSNAATLTVLQPVQITTQPTSTSKCVGENVTFMVTATGSNLTYQWKKGGTAIMGATTNIFQLTDVQASDAGDYAVEVSNPCGMIPSSVATLTINPNPTVANAGPNQSNVCEVATLQANTPTSGTGRWTATPNSGTFGNVNQAGTTFSGNIGQTYTLTWRISSDFCGASSDQVTIQFSGDSDNDTVSDCKDLCPGGDDRQNSDGAGMPDACDCNPNDSNDEVGQVHGFVHIDSSITPRLYQFAFEIYSYGKIQFGNTVDFRAGHSITLLPGFHAKAGSAFTAAIELCVPPPTTIQVANLEAQARSSSTTSIDISPKTVPLSWSAYPNPFHAKLSVTCDLATLQPDLSLAIYDQMGRLTKMVFANQSFSAGLHEWPIDGTDLPTGITYLLLQTSENILVKKVIRVE